MRYLLVALMATFLTGCGYIYPTKEVVKEEQDKSVLEEISEVFKKKEFEETEEPAVDTETVKTFFNEYNVVLPNGNRVRVCSAYGCTNQQVFRLSADLLKRAKSEFSSSWTAAGERQGLAKALALIEQEVGVDDTAGDSFWGNGNANQMNSIDEALNTTSYLMVMYRYGLVRYHDLLGPARVGGAFSSQAVVVLRDRESKKKWAINTGVSDNGGEVSIIELN